MFATPDKQTDTTAEHLLGINDMLPSGAQKSGMLRFSYNPRRTVEAALFFLEKHGRSMGPLRLIKLLYLSDREAIRAFSTPICGGQYFSLPHGPIISEPLDQINEPTTRVLRRTGKYVVERLADFDPQALSDAEIEVLEAVDARFRGMTDAQLYDFVHDAQEIPEYEKPVESSRLPIDPVRIYHAVGRDEGHAQRAAADWEADHLLRQLLGY